MNRSIANIVLIRGVCLFGSWTIFCYLLVLTASDFSTLKTWCFVPVITGLVLGSLCLSGPVEVEGNSINRVAPGFYSRGEITVAIVLVALIAVSLRVVDVPYWSVWVVLLCTLFLVFRTHSTVVVRQSEQPIPVLKSQGIGVAALVVLGAILVAIAHRPDPDDAQYLNFAVTALDFPLEPLFSRSGLWQDHSTPLELPIYRLHTYELLVAVFSDVFSVDHKIVYYLILAPMFGGIAVLVHWALARYLMPQHALTVLLVWLVITIALGASHREFGNFAFVRLYQAKAIFVSVALPLCLLLGLRFAERPDWRRALALGMAVFASLGMSSSALATVPFVVTAALSGGLLGARASATPTIVGGLGALFVLLIVGGALALTMNVDSHQVDGGAGDGLSLVLGEELLGAVVLALFPLAPLFVSDSRRRQLYMMATLTFVLVVLNPWTAPVLATQLDSALLWRLFWSMPLVLSAAICLTALATLASNKVPRIARPAVLPLILLAILLLSPQTSLSPDNLVVIDFPRFKVEPAEHALAEEIVHRAPQRSTIYAPTPVASLITTFRLHPYPLIVRPEYTGFKPIREHFENEELIRRRGVIRLLEGSNEPSLTTAFFQVQLESDHPAFVVYDRSIAMAPAIGAVLENAGYVGEERGRYRLWHLE